MELEKPEIRPDPKKAAPKTIMEELHGQKKIKIMIASTERDKEAVTVGVNGYHYNIPRDQWVEVPESVIEVLNNSKMTTYTQKKREAGEGNEMVAVDVARFPYQTKVA